MATRPAPSQLQTENRPERPANDFSLYRVSRSEKLTIAVLREMRPGDVVRDSALGGFYAQCGKRGVSLKIAADLEYGKTVRKTIGRFPALDLTEARLQASRLLAEIKTGRDPRQSANVAPAAPAGALTVGAAIDRYLADMTTRKCAAKTIKFTGARLRKHLAPLLDVAIDAVKPSDCQTAHARITTASGDVAANKTLRDFRAVWNLAAKQSDTPERFTAKCPVASVTMNAEASVRANAVVTDLPGWWRRVGGLGNPLRTAMFRLGLLSGLRPGNLAGIRREWIRELHDPARARIEFPASAMKGRGAKRRPFMLPLSPAMVALVRQALEDGPKLVSVPDGGGWLFPTRSRDGRSVVATSNWTEPTLGSNECGHALRHTYRTLAAGAGVPYDVAEMLVAHVLPGVGSRYVHPGELEARLRSEQERVTAFILGKCGAVSTA